MKMAILSCISSKHEEDPNKKPPNKLKNENENKSVKINLRKLKSVLLNY